MSYAGNYADFPDYIIRITKEIWEDRGIETLNRTYAADIPVRSPMGIQRGNQAVIASTMATINEFPDRQLLAEDVIWSEDAAHGHLSSHRLLTTATHSRDGQFGPATGKRWTVRVIADCAADGATIYGDDAPPFTPAMDVDGGYHGRGNANPWGQRYADTLTRIMDTDFAHILTGYDRAVIGEYAGARQAIGREAVTEFWVGLRSAIPNAEFKIHHQIGMDGDMLSPRAAIRWSLDGLHEGWGSFGKPTGAPVHVMGISHAEFGPWGLRREYALYDEVAIWKQILLHVGAP